MANYLVPELLRKKRDGGELTSDEIAFLVQGFSKGTIPDYQVSAWLMASFIRGLNVEETAVLTREMKNSGKHYDWAAMSANFKNARFADKHSSGGIGDKVSLILAPVAACLGLKVPMMSGRGLGHTGGTVDKLEAIPGFSLYLNEAQLVRLLDEVGVCMMAQSPEICPADRKLYHLRDVTGTVENTSLITASIVSKKWAEGVNTIVYDVKCGEAAFMSDLTAARGLAKSLYDVSKAAGMNALCCLTRMEEPLGSRIGHALEVEESLWILSNEYPSEEHRRLAASLKKLSLRLAAEMAALAGAYPSLDEALKAAEESIASGKAWKVFQRMAELQGAEAGWIDKLAKAPLHKDILSPQEGTLTSIASRRLGLAVIRMGGGRLKSEDKIDPAVGIEVLVRPGDAVRKGQPLLRLHLGKEGDGLFNELATELPAIFTFGAKPSFDPGELMIEKYPA